MFSYYAAIPLCALHSSSSAQNHDINSKSLECVAFITRGLSELVRRVPDGDNTALILPLGTELD